MPPASRTRAVPCTSLQCEFISQLEKTGCLVPKQDIETICTEMGGIMTELCQRLRTGHPFFKGCYPILRGSMREMTKIDAADEIDYMIYIPDVSEHLHLELDKTQRVGIKIHPYTDLSSNRITQLMTDELEASLPQEWSLPLVNSVYHHIHNTLTRSYLIRRPSSKPVRDISVDIALVTELHGSFVVLARDWQYGLLTFPQEELQLIHELENQTYISPCYQYAKYLAQHFFGHQDIIQTGYSLRKPYLPSYAIKTILLHMLASSRDTAFHHSCMQHNESYTQQEQFSIVYDVFENLLKALEKKELKHYFVAEYDVFALSKSFKPDYVRKKCKVLLGLLDRIKREEKSSVLKLCNPLGQYKSRHFAEHICTRSCGCSAI